MTKAIATISRTREIIEKYQIRAKKNFGQNFLVDASIAKRIAQTIPEDGVVIEIGPGIGSLTEQLAQHSSQVIAYEVDERLLPILKEELKDYTNIQVILQDFLECDLENDLKEYGDTLYVAANLPYYITSPVLFKLFESSLSFPIITVMMQKEVADRFIAKPGTKEYGSISVEGQYLYDIKRVCNAPKNAFMPSPKVDSTVLTFERKKIVVPVNNQNEFFMLIKACFKQRRKTLYNNLKDYLQDKDRAESLLKELDKPLTIRAEELSLEDFLKLYQLIEEQA